MLRYLWLPTTTCMAVLTVLVLCAPVYSQEHPRHDWDYTDDDDMEQPWQPSNAKSAPPPYTLPLPYTYLDVDQLPESFSWGGATSAMAHGRGRGRSYLTKSLNQHLPQYCGSCWAHAAVSVLSDRIQIAKGLHHYHRKHVDNNKNNKDKNKNYQNDDNDDEAVVVMFDEFNLSVQFLLNCGGGGGDESDAKRGGNGDGVADGVVGSCHGGSTIRAFAWIRDTMGFIPVDTCQPYLACSRDLTEGICPYVDTTCHAPTICRTCWPTNPTTPPTNDNADDDVTTTSSSVCSAVPAPFPNATIAEYGVYFQPNVTTIQAEVWMRGPVKTSIDATPILDYTGGVLWDSPEYHTNLHNHGVSIVGWGSDPNHDNDQYWIVRNSWGQYWGEMGYFRVQLGRNLLNMEQKITWATPKHFSVWKKNCPKPKPINKDAKQQQQQQEVDHQENCLTALEYVDPSHRADYYAQLLQSGLGREYSYDFDNNDVGASAAVMK
ncbi:hypothetical protein ACA910_015026 [Epithemia clementina (nom. ined.)]